MKKKLIKFNLTILPLNYQALQFQPSQSAIETLCQLSFAGNPSGCPNYGRNWGCPPHTYLMQEMQNLLQSKSHLFLLTNEYHIPLSLQRLKSGKKRARKLFTLSTAMAEDLNQLCHALQESLTDAVVLFASNCQFCSDNGYGTCTCPAEPCRFPRYRQTPPEAAGIDIFTTLKGLNVALEENPHILLRRIGLCATNYPDQFHTIISNYLKEHQL